MTISAATKAIVRERAGNRCQGTCGQDFALLERRSNAFLRRQGYDLSRSLAEFHHPTQQAHDGPDDPDNLELWCQLCHRAVSRVQVHEAAKAQRAPEKAPVYDPERKALKLRQRIPPVRGLGS